MAKALCTGCGGELKRHCRKGNECGWWRCPDRTCTHSTYDVRRGILVYRDGRVERLGV